MKITRIEAERVAIPFETGGPRHAIRPGLASRPWLKMEALLVRVATEDGRVGWGEGFGHMANPGTEALLGALVGPWFLGRDAEPVAATMQEAQQAFHGFGRSGPAVYALSAIDIALWDLAAQRANAPLWRLLGGRGGSLEMYASLMRYGGDVDAVGRNAARAAAAGYRMIKLHETTVPAFLAARAAVDPATRIMLDVNCPWPVEEAREVARTIRDKGFHWLEEPVWPPDDYAGLAAVRGEGVAIAAGENVTQLHDFRRLLEAGAVDVVQPSVTKVGGITAMLRILALAQAWPVRVVPHCFYWGPGYLATAHVIAAMPKPAPLETAFIELERRPHPLFAPERSAFALPETPGLGFAPDKAVLEAYRVSRTVVE